MKNIEWAKWASVAEIISSVAILVTLLYLAIQTQQNTDSINSQSRQSLADSAVFEQTLWLQNPKLSSFIVDNSIRMTFEQKVQLDSLMHCLLQDVSMLFVNIEQEFSMKIFGNTKKKFWLFCWVHRELEVGGILLEGIVSQKILRML